MVSHFKTFSILGYVMAGLSLLALLLIILHGLMMVFLMPTGPAPNAPPVEFWIFMAVYYCLIGMLNLAVIVMNVVSARQLANGTGRRMLIATAIANMLPCTMAWFFTLILGIFQLIFFLNHQVKEVYAKVQSGSSLDEAVRQVEGKSNRFHGQQPDQPDVEVNSKWDET